MASEVTLRRHRKRELLAMVERGLAVQEELWRLQEQHEVRGEIVAEQAGQLAACRDEIARLTAALDAREREVAALREDVEFWHADYFGFQQVMRSLIERGAVRAEDVKYVEQFLVAPPQRPATGEGAE